MSWTRRRRKAADRPRGSAANAVGSAFFYRGAHFVDPIALTITGDPARVYHVSSDPLYAYWSPSGAFVVVVGGLIGQGVWAAAPAR